LRFDRRLGRVTAEEFVQRILIDGLDVRYLVVGDDFRFGQGRSGDFRLLAAGNRGARGLSGGEHAQLSKSAASA
jgi:riboflavin kinase / FMN adenylyltransferase